MEKLFEILQDAKDTEFGKLHGFGYIRTLEQYQKEVPVSGYDDYAAYIYRMYVNGETNLITPYPVVRYITFLGMMENPKRIPLTERNTDIMDGFKEYQPMDGSMPPKTEEEIQEGEFYRVIMTNYSGLYRYLTRDVVQGQRNESGQVVPVFAYKVNQVADIAGELVTAAELKKAVVQWAQEMELSMTDVTMYQREEPDSKAYVILPEVNDLDYGIDVEDAQDRLDRILCEINTGYANVRKQGKLGSCRIYFLLPGTFANYIEQKKEKGISEEFITVPMVIHNEITKRYFLSMVDECI